jgi:DNA-binding NarL/FixJ family response regulator
LVKRLEKGGNVEQVIRVILADDHDVVRRGIRSFLEEDPAIKVVAEADDGLEAISCIEAHRPDVAVLDIQMPHHSGIDVARRVRAQGLRTGLLILTAFDDDPYLMASICVE